MYVAVYGRTLTSASFAGEPLELVEASGPRPTEPFFMKVFKGPDPKPVKKPKGGKKGK